MRQKLVLPLIGGRKAMKMKWLLDPDGLVCPGKVAPGQCPEPARAGARPDAASLDVFWGGACIKLFNVGSSEVIPLLGLHLLLHVLTKARVAESKAKRNTGPWCEL